MAALTEGRNTKCVLSGGIFYNYMRIAAGTIHAGSLVAQNSEGKAVAASDAEGLLVLGRAEASVSAGANLNVRSGTYLWENGTSTEALTAADIGKMCFVVDDQTVGKIGGTHKIVAGLVLDVTEEGVVVAVGGSVLGLAAASHTHAIADVTGLQAALDAKSNA